MEAAQWAGRLCVNKSAIAMQGNALGLAGRAVAVGDTEKEQR